MDDRQVYEEKVHFGDLESVTYTVRDVRWVKKIHCTDKDNPLNSVNILSLNSLSYSFSWILISQINNTIIGCQQNLAVKHIFIKFHMFCATCADLFWTMCIWNGNVKVDTRVWAANKIPKTPQIQWTNIIKKLYNNIDILKSVW